MEPVMELVLYLQRGVLYRGPNTIWYSETGTSWYVGSGDLFNANFNSACYGVAYGTSNGDSPLWVAVSKDNGNNNIVYSENRKVWTNANNGNIFSYGTAVAYGTSGGVSPLWAAVGTSTTTTMAYSENGKDWTLVTEGDITTSDDITNIVCRVCGTNIDLPF